MASAARIASVTQEPPRYPEDLKPTIQRSETRPRELLYAPYSTASSPSAKYEPGENFPFFTYNNTSSFTPAPSPPPISTITPHPSHSHASHVIPSIDTFALPQGQLPPLLANRQEYSPSAWPYPPTYEATLSPQPEIFYQRERDHVAHYPPRLNHRSSPQANRLPGSCTTYSPCTHDYVHNLYPSMDDFRYTDCRSSPHRIVYPQAVYPDTGAAPYSRPVQTIAVAPEKPFLCETCGSRFNRNHDLKRHARIHLPIKPFPCGWCDQAFSRKDALKRHLIVKACSGSKEVSVDESLRRAEQMGKKTFKDTSSYTSHTSSAASEKKSLRKEESDDAKHVTNFNSSIPCEYPIHSSCPSSCEQNYRSPSTDATFHSYLVRDRLCSVSDDSNSTSGSVNTCSS